MRSNRKFFISQDSKKEGILYINLFIKEQNFKSVHIIFSL